MQQKVMLIAKLSRLQVEYLKFRHSHYAISAILELCSRGECELLSHNTLHCDQWHMSYTILVWQVYCCSYNSTFVLTAHTQRVYTTNGSFAKTWSRLIS